MAAPASGSSGARDADLVAQVMRGDREAYAVLVNRHQQLLYSHARGMGLDHDTSLDIVQDAFIKAYTRIEECHDAARFRAWVFRIARNLCLDHVRSVRRSVIPMSEFGDVESIAVSETSFDDVKRTLREALFHLPPMLREAFLLKHDAGYTYDEVAEITNTSPSAAKMRVHRARSLLRTFLIEQGVTAA